MQNKSKIYLLISIVLIVIIVAALFILRGNFGSGKNINNCIYLAERFDKNIDSPFANCGNISKSPFYVGGTLINISMTKGTGGYDHYVLILKGKEATSSIILSNTGNANNLSLIYQIGNFYRFDLNGFCYLMTSAASSGAFYDPEFNAFESMSC